MSKNVNRITDITVIAMEIFHMFEINQSCTITGFVTIQGGRVETRGEHVLIELEKLDSLHYTTGIPGRDGRFRRKRVKPRNTVGGYVAQKMFKFKHEIIDQEARTTIWRIQ